VHIVARARHPSFRMQPVCTYRSIALPTLAWIVLANTLGSALAVGGAAAFALAARAHWVPALISYAIGALLGAAFLEILPHAVESAANTQGVIAMVLVGILLFFLLEKLVIWRHHHTDDGHSHASELHDHGRSGLMILLGNTFHNLVDGVIIAAAFLQSVELGVITAVAIFAHAIPQQVSDFVILLHSGFTKQRALLFSLVSSLATVLGGLLAYAALRGMQQIVPYLLGIAAASMIYVAVADLMPSLHKRPEIRATLQQVILIGLGVGSIALTDLLLARH
jgi:zinc and cadmium transporter